MNKNTASITALNKLNNSDLNLFLKDAAKYQSDKEILYYLNTVIFESSKFDHEQRLSLLNKLYQISKDLGIDFCIAHNLTLTIKLSKELGITKNLIKDSHKVIQIWKSILNKEELAVNGLIFSYADLGLLYSEYKLYTLSLQYLQRAESLLMECKEQYNPFKKLYVAFAVVYDNMGNAVKALDAYNKVLKEAKLQNDIMTQIPILVNTSNMLSKNKNYDKAMIKCKRALKYSKQTKETIYRPYILRSYANLYLKLKLYIQAESEYQNSYNYFKKIKSAAKIPELLFDLGALYFYQKKFSESEKFLQKALKKNKNLNQLELNIKIVKKLCSIYKIQNNEILYIKYNEILMNDLEKSTKKINKRIEKVNQDAISYLIDEFDFSIKEKDNIHLKVQLESKKRELTTKALRTISEKEFLEKIIKMLSMTNKDNKQIIRMCKSRLSGKQSWNIFMKLFNDIHPSFNQFLIKKCSQLTQSELRICNLIKMSFSSVEIADILSISIRGVEQHRYRIKKKLKLNADLTIFIHSL